MKKLRGSFVCGLALMMMLSLAIVVAPRASASSGASQIALSCQGPGSFSASTNANTCAGVTSCPSTLTTAVVCISNIGGFWIWCETPSASNHYMGECNGALYQVEFTSGVFSYQIKSVTGDATGLSAPFMVAVGPSGSTECTFTVTAPLLPGQSSSVPASCTGTVSFPPLTTTGAFTVGFGSTGPVGFVAGFTGTFAPGVVVLS